MILLVTSKNSNLNCYLQTLGLHFRPLVTRVSNEIPWAVEQQNPDYLQLSRYNAWARIESIGHERNTLLIFNFWALWNMICVFATERALFIWAQRAAVMPLHVHMSVTCCVTTQTWSFAVFMFSVGIKFRYFCLWQDVAKTTFYPPHVLSFWYHYVWATTPCRFLAVNEAQPGLWNFWLMISCWTQRSFHCHQHTDTD